MDAVLSADGIQSLAICLINSYVNPAHEEALRDIVRERRPDLPVSISSEILREVREYERTATVVVNAYVHAHRTSNTSRRSTALCARPGSARRC